jgi:hypothetical protein
VRIIAATNRDLAREVARGTFRQDLFFRLGQSLKVPPLREHLDDMPALVNHFLARLCVEYKRRVTLTEAALNRLQSYCWPGNVRQLRSVLDTAVAMSESGVIHAGDLHLVDELNVPQGDGPASLNLEDLEMWAIRRALAQTNANNTHAAKLLGIHRDTLIAKLKKAAAVPAAQAGRLVGSAGLLVVTTAGAGSPAALVPWMASKTSWRWTGTSLGATMPRRTLSPRISTTVTVMSLLMTILSFFFLDSTSIAAYPSPKMRPFG